MNDPGRERSPGTRKRAAALAAASAGHGDRVRAAPVSRALEPAAPPSRSCLRACSTLPATRAVRGAAIAAARAERAHEAQGVTVGQANRTDRSEPLRRRLRIPSGRTG